MQTNDIKKKLIAEITAAFSTGTPPQPDKEHISGLCSDDEGTAHGKGTQQSNYVSLSLH